MISRKYLYLIALARERHFGRAAAACHVSPSTLSTGIRDLERELGVVLVERGQQFAGFTPEGECAVAHAKRAVADAEDLRQALDVMRGGLSGQLRIGVIPTALAVISALTAPFARSHPRVNIEVRSASTQTILAQLRSFELEAGVLYVESGGANDLHCLPLWEEDLAFLTRSNGPFAGRDELEWCEAARQPLCLLSRDMQNRQTIDAVFARLGCTPQVSLETNSILSILAHVRAGPWGSVLPRNVLGLIGAPTGFHALRLVAPAVKWHTGLVTLAREPRSPMIAALLEQAAAPAGRTLA